MKIKNGFIKFLCVKRENNRWKNKTTSYAQKKKNTRPTKEFLCMLFFSITSPPFFCLKSVEEKKSIDSLQGRERERSKIFFFLTFFWWWKKYSFFYFFSQWAFLFFSKYRRRWKTKFIDIKSEWKKWLKFLIMKLVGQLCDED